MASFNQYPYRDYNDFNLDWVIKTVKEAVEQWTQYRADMDQWKTDTEAAFDDLYNYVHDYFDNLDLTEEVRKQIDRLVTNGTLEAIVTVVIGDYNQRLDEMESRLDVIEAGTTPEGSELTDVRVGYDGHVYASAGTAVRDQVRALWDTGLMHRYSGSNPVQNFNITLQEDIPVYFRNVVATGGVQLHVYAYYDSANYDTVLITRETGRIYKFVPDKEYIRLRVAVQPYSASWTGAFQFDILQSNLPGVAYDLYEAQVTADSISDSLILVEPKVESARIVTYNYPITAGVPIYFRECYCSDSRLNLSLYYKVSGSWVLLKTTRVNGRWYKIIPEYDSTQYRISISPYIEFSGSYAYQFIQTDKLFLPEDAYTAQRRTAFSTNLTRILRKVVAVGDSYTSGHIQAPDDASATPTNAAYAWPEYMAKITGQTYINCGVSGCNCATWLTNPRGLRAARDAGRAQAYIIGIMINDASDGDKHLDVGTSADIGTDNNTYYAQLSKVIREISAISPDAYVFVQTVPRTEARYSAYNAAVRDIVAQYAAQYHTILLDLYAARDLYAVPEITNDASHGHYTAVAYEQFAEILNYLISEYIGDHVTEFQRLHNILID